MGVVPEDVVPGGQQVVRLHQLQGKTSGQRILTQKGAGMCRRGGGRVVDPSSWDAYILGLAPWSLNPSDRCMADAIWTESVGQDWVTPLPLDFWCSESYSASPTSTRQPHAVQI